MTYPMRLMRGGFALLLYALLLFLTIPLRLFTVLVESLVTVLTNLDDEP